MQDYLINRYEDYCFNLLLATLFHVLLFLLLFLSLHHRPKLFLNASAPPAIIYATAVKYEQLPLHHLGQGEKIKPPVIMEKKMLKPVLVEKSPITLAIKAKKPTLEEINRMPLPAKSPLKKVPTEKKVPTQPPTSYKPVSKEKRTSNAHSAKSMQLAQKNVQQLLQQEVNTLVQKHQIAARNAATTEKFRHLILQAIAQHWILPPEVNKNSETKLAVHLAPGGMVLEVVIVKSSGNPVLDRSAQTAVYKASPLPVPKNSLFNTFRQINLTVRPEGVLKE